MSARQKISIYRFTQQVPAENDELFELIAFLHGLDSAEFQWEWLDALCAPDSCANGATVLPQVFINGELWLQGRYPDIFELSDKLKMS